MNLPAEMKRRTFPLRDAMHPSSRSSVQNTRRRRRREKRRRRWLFRNQQNIKTLEPGRDSWRFSFPLKPEVLVSWNPFYWNFVVIVFLWCSCSKRHLREKETRRRATHELFWNSCLMPVTGHLQWSGLVKVSVGVVGVGYLLIFFLHLFELNPSWDAFVVFPELERQGFRNWTFTWNYWTGTEFDTIQSLKSFCTVFCFITVKFMTDFLYSALYFALFGFVESEYNLSFVKGERDNSRKKTKLNLIRNNLLN